MDSGGVITHPSTVEQAKAFTAPASLSFPGGAEQLITSSSEKDGQPSETIDTNAKGSATTEGASSTPADAQVAGQGVSGIVPTLQ